MTSISDFFVTFVSILGGSLAMMGAWYCNRMFNRMLTLAGEMYARLDEEFEPAPLGTPEEIAEISKQSSGAIRNYQPGWQHIPQWGKKP